jgi:hypothetical protein
MVHANAGWQGAHSLQQAASSSSTCSLCEVLVYSARLDAGLTQSTQLQPHQQTGPGGAERVPSLHERTDFEAGEKRALIAHHLVCKRQLRE